MSIIKMTELDLHHKRVLIREDLNVPISKGKVTSMARIEAIIPTLRIALRQEAKIMLLSHLGRPTEGHFDPEFSLEPVTACLEKLLDHPIRFVRDWLEGVDIKPGEIVLCENVRFCVGEYENNSVLAQKMARLCDVFVMDAFGTAHRKQVSTYGIAKYAPVACAGPLLMDELNALARILEKPVRPLMAIVGGSKVSTKLKVLASLIDSVDLLMVGGGIANTFIAASGLPVGKSLCEPAFIPEAKRIMKTIKERGGEIPLPVDVVVAKSFADASTATIKNIHDVTDDDMILDIGPQTISRLPDLLKNVRTILWNGPLGVFECDAFAEGTKALAHAIAASSAFSVAGGGDTLAAIDKFGVANQISYISTGGGAFLEFLEDGTLPAVKILDNCVVPTAIDF